MADNIITTIGIAAKADTKKAQEDLKDLSAELSRLKMVAKEGLEVGNFSKSMKEISNLFSNFNTDAMRRVSETITAMNSVRTVTISKTLPERMSALAKSIKDFDVPQLYQIVTGLRELKKIGDFSISSKGLTGLQKLSISFSQTPAAPVLEDIDKGAEKAEDSLEDMNNEAEKSPSIWKRLGASVAQSTEKIGQFWSSIKRIAMYRAIRSALKAITQGFREGIQNMYQYSILINGQFKDSMDSLATTALYLKNSMGALIAPLINQLAPVIERIVDGFVDFTNVLAELFAMIGGQDTWSRALKYPKAYAEQMEGASGAAKELRATLLGFDEINRLDDNRRGGRGSAADLMDYSKMFEEVTTRKLSDFWDDFVSSGETKFALFAATAAGLLALKLSGALGGVFAGSGAIALGGQLAAAVAAGFAGYRFGNWLYENDIFGIGSLADRWMNGGLGDFISDVGKAFKDTWTNFTENGLGAFESIKKGFEPLAKNIKEGWDLMLDVGTDWGDKIWETAEGAWGKFTNWVDKHNVFKVKVDVEHSAWETFANMAINEITYMLELMGIKPPEKTTTTTYSGGRPYSTPYTEPENKTPPYSTPNANVYQNLNPDNAISTIKKTTNALAKNMENLIVGIGSITSNSLLFRAGGGSVETGSLFLANENGPELIGQVGNKTQVANNDQITESIKIATMAGNAEGNALLRQAVNLLNGIYAKDNVVVANVTTDSITSGLDRQNRRNGRTTVPVGV